MSGISWIVSLLPIWIFLVLLNVTLMTVTTPLGLIVHEVALSLPFTQTKALS